jgi:tetratricopeptide (TPR) repeat protein
LRTLRSCPGFDLVVVRLRDLVGLAALARGVYRRVASQVHCKPDYAEACYNLGNVLAELKQHDGMVLAELARYAEAEPCYQEALRLKPGFADAHANFGNAYKEQGRLEEAVASYDIALAEGSPLPDFDVHAPLMSLPHLCRTTLTSIPATVPYLFANETGHGNSLRC